MPIKLLPLFETAEISKVAAENARQHLGMRSVPERIESIKIFLSDADAAFKQLNERWKALSAGDKADLDLMKERMVLVLAHVATVNTYLRSIETPYFRWDAVFLSMGYISAHQAAIEEVLQYNKKLAA